MRRSLIFFAAPLLVFFLISSAFAPTDPIPHMINYQGMLTNDEGTPLNGLYDLTFRIYDVPSGGTALWTGNFNDEEVLNGLFNVILEIPPSVFNGAERYMGITVWPDAELSPRTRLTSVGYAYVAETAVTSGTDGDWTISGDNIYSAVSGKVGIGITSPAAKLDIDGSGQSYAVQAQGGSSYSIRGEWGGSSLGAAVLAKNTGTGGDAIQAMADGSGRSAVWARGNTGVDYAIYGNANGATWAGYFAGDVYTSGDLQVGGDITGQVPGVEYSNASGSGTETSLSTSWLTLKSVTVTHPGTGYVVCIGTGFADFDLTSFTGTVYAGWTTSASGTPDSYLRISLSTADYSTYIPLTAIHTFLVSGSGSTTFYFRARISSGTSTDMDFFEGSVAAMYFPTKY